jgi:hypothetical protein
MHFTAPPEGGEYGTPPILIETAYDCPECNQTHLLEECPNCGSRDIEYGYGLGFGPGIGSYKLCDCGWSYKKVLPEEE